MWVHHKIWRPAKAQNGWEVFKAGVHKGWFWKLWRYWRPDEPPTTKTGALTVAGAYFSVANTMGLKQKDVKAAVEGYLALAVDQQASLQLPLLVVAVAVSSVEDYLVHACNE